MRSLFCLAALLLVSGCCVAPPDAKNVQGHYTLKGDWYVGHSLTLREGRATFNASTDVVGDPCYAKYPLHGVYTVAPDCLEIRYANGTSEEYRIRRAGWRLFALPGRYILWTPHQVEEYRRTNRKPNDLLYQKKLED